MQTFNRKKLLLAVDIIILALVYLVGVLLIELAGDLERNFVQYIVYLIIFGMALFASRAAFKVYANVWRYANSAVYMRTILADAVGGLVAIIVMHLPLVNTVSLGFWKGVAFVAVYDIATLFSRSIYKIIYERSHHVSVEKERRIPVAIAGAGQVGTLLAQELLYNGSSRFYPVCFIDKDQNKVGSKILGLEVYPEDDAIECLKDLAVKEVIFAITSMPTDEMRQLTLKYAGAGYGVKVYDAPLEDQGNEKHVIREIKIEDLLFRQSIQVFDENTRAYYSGKRVLVTGGGGSIGS